MLTQAFLHIYPVMNATYSRNVYIIHLPVINKCSCGRVIDQLANLIFSVGWAVILGYTLCFVFSKFFLKNLCNSTVINPCVNISH